MVRNFTGALVSSAPVDANAAGAEWDEEVRARFLLIGTISIGLIPGSDGAQAQDTSGTTEVLPAIEVSPPPTSAKPGQARNTRRVAQNLRRVLVYPTAPTPTA